MFKVIKNHNKHSMYRKLFEYLLMFAGMLLVYILVAMTLIGQFKDVGYNYEKNLDLQSSVMKKEIKGYFGKAAISAMDLSKTASQKMEDLLDKEGIPFQDLKDRQDLLVQAQDAIFEDIKNSMYAADVSGAFVLWDTTVNSKLDRKGNFKSGLYLEIDSRSIRESSIITYRGDVDVARKHHSMPHRKWKLEYDVSGQPSFFGLDRGHAPLYESYRMTPVFTLPGTDQKVILITLPIIGGDGCFYGICGFEVEQLFFKEILAQPSKFERVTNLFFPNFIQGEKVDANMALGSGTERGYYYMPRKPLTMKTKGEGLMEFSSQGGNYLGLVRELPLLKNSQPSQLLVMVPKEDVDRDFWENLVTIVVSIVLFLFFSIGGGLIFTKRYITPITEGLAMIENQENLFVEDSKPDAETIGFYEIDELIRKLRENVKSENDDRIPDYLSKKFRDFIQATENLTPAEMNVLTLLIQGHNVDELPDILFISKSTAKHHILRIYKKLNVSSRGELLLYLDMIKGCGMIDHIVGPNDDDGAEDS